MLQRKRLRLATSILVFALLQAAAGDNYTDGNRPYEFGFNVEVEGRQHQHRHEVKNEDGIVKGEFGFVTADDVYHVTVFAVDKDGHYNILSTKNIKLKSSPDGSSPLARMGHSLTLPTPGFAALAVTAVPSALAESASPINSTLVTAPVSSTAQNTLPIITAKTKPTSALVTSKSPAGHTMVDAVTTAATTTAAVVSAGSVIPNSLTASITSTVFPTKPIVSTLSPTAPVTSPASPTTPNLQSTFATDGGLVSVPTVRNNPAALATTLKTSTPPTMAPARIDIQTSLPTLTTLIESTARTTLNLSAALSAITIPAISTGVITPATLEVPTAAVLSKPNASVALDNSAPAALTLPAVTLSTETPTTPNGPTATIARSLPTAAPITMDKSEITLSKSIDTTTEPFKVISLEPAVNSCAGCSLPTATSETLVVNFPPKNNVSLPIPVIALRTNIAKQGSIVTPGATANTLSNQSKQNLANLVIPKTLNNYAHPGIPILVEQIPSFGIHSSLIQKPKGSSPVHNNSPDSSRPSIELNSNILSSMQSSKTSVLPQQNVQRNSKDSTATRTSKILNTPQQELIQQIKNSTPVQGNYLGIKQNSDSSSPTQNFNDAGVPQTNKEQKIKDELPTKISNTVDGPQQNAQQNSKYSSEVMTLKTLDGPIQKSISPSPLQSDLQDSTHQSDKQNSNSPSLTQSSNVPHLPKSNKQQNLNDRSPTVSSKMVGGPNLASVQKSNGLSSVQTNSKITTPQSIKQNSNSLKGSTAKTLDEQKLNNSAPVQSNSENLSHSNIKQNSEMPSPTQSSNLLSSGQPNNKSNLKDKSSTENSNTQKDQKDPSLTKISKTLDVQSSPNSQGDDQNSIKLPTHSSKTTPILTQPDSKDQKRTSKTLDTIQKDSIQKSNENDESSKQDSNSPQPTPTSSPLSGSERHVQPTPITSTPEPHQVSKENLISTLPTQSSNPSRGSMRYVPPNSNPIKPHPGPSQQDIQQRTPKQNAPVDRGPMKYNGPKPKLVSADFSVVDKNTDIHALSPGENSGLPGGLEVGDMSKILYTFNYTVGFHSHFEEGYANGSKKGYYYVTGRNGVRTRIDYVADVTGFHPKVSQEVLDLISDDVPKPETEKDAKFGLKNNVFKWLYYPVESNKQKLLPIF